MYRFVRDIGKFFTEKLKGVSRGGLLGDFIMREIEVSICCLTYNHEKYVRKALDGFVMQKTNFKYEVIVHDDASTDNTQSIIQEYAEKYPDLIKPIYQKENIFSKGISPSREVVYPMTMGRYIAECEGDDYWTDENKLQKQYDALEAHENCSMCVHKTKMIRENGEDSGFFYPQKRFVCETGAIDKRKRFNWHTGVIDQHEILKCIFSYPFQTSSYFFRKKIVEPYINGEIYYKCFGDRIISYLGAVSGDFYFINSDMSNYRMFSIGSFFSNAINEINIFGFDGLISHIKLMESINSYTKYEFDKYFKVSIANTCFSSRLSLSKIKLIFKSNHIKFNTIVKVEKRVLIKFIIKELIRELCPKGFSVIKKHITNQRRKKIQKRYVNLNEQ